MTRLKPFDTLIPLIRGRDVCARAALRRITVSIKSLIGSTKETLSESNTLGKHPVKTS
jgi:hypothetical protein